MKQTKQLVPKLRFPEFKNSWEIKKLGDYASFSKGKGISKSDIIEDGQNLCIRYGELYTKYNEKITKNKVVSRTNVSIDKSNLSKNNDVIIPSSGETQLDIATASYLQNDGIILGGDLNIIRSKFNGLFLAYYLNNKKKIDIAKLAQGNSVVHLYNKNLSSLYLNIPSLPEQQKIADFLSQVDNKIDLLRQKLDHLEQYKKGVMQKLFSQEVRFKRGLSGVEGQGDGSDYPDWEEKSLGEIGNTYNGLTGKTKKDFGEGFKYIQYKQIFDDSKIKTENCAKVIVSEDESQNEVKFGDVFFTVSSETPDEIATASVLLDKVSQTYLNSFCFGYRLDQEKMSPFFARYLFRSSNFRKRIIPLGQGSTRFNISKNSFVKLNCLIPCLEEQTKIANYLNAIDQKISFTQQQLKQTQAFKKGLLQKMFV